MKTRSGAVLGDNGEKRKAPDGDENGRVKRRLVQRNEQKSERRKWSREEKTGSEQRTGEGEDPQGNPSLCISSVLCLYLPLQILVCAYFDWSDLESLFDCQAIGSTSFADQSRFLLCNYRLERIGAFTLDSGMSLLTESFNGN
ncbi:unnamed protein product [Microthlaspi erraticum]|uniref:Uncharacterized protein n=1 Tax=Microthlaspi erraticum TaxID=1685480 RepID=A0A6D2IUE0_9BRAS|nr:unnamed protein product [Microthlaspi erraticum]